MPIFTGEPFRAYAQARLRVAAQVQNFHAAWVREDASNFGSTPADGATWEGTPGSSMTLRFRWISAGTGSGTGAATAPNFATVEIRIPGTATVLATWTVAFPAASTDVTNTFFFSSTPFTTSGSPRAGSVEIYLRWGNNGGVSPWSVDTRGVTTGTILVTDDAVWAAGYLRSTQTLVSHSISNASLGGAEPALFAAPDPLHTRITYGAAWFRAGQPTLEVIASNNTTVERSGSAASGVGPTYDFSWTGTTGLNRRVGTGMELSQALKDLRLTLTTLDFGGDNEYFLAASGHQAGWTVLSGTQIVRLDRISVDPRTFPRGGGTGGLTSRGCLYQTQNVGQAFADPPSSGDDSSGQRLFPDVGFISVRYLNARTEGIDGLTTTLKLWDAGSIGSSEGTPAHTFTGDTATRRSASPNTTPQAGWLPLAPGGVDRDKLPITWSTVFGGTWRVKSVVIAPADMTGLESYSLSSGGAFWNRNLFLVVVSPNYSPLCAVIRSGTVQQRHLEQNDDLLLISYMEDLSLDGKLVQLVEANSDQVQMNLTRVDPVTGRMQYLDPTTLVWTGKVDAGSVPSFLLIRASVAFAGGDPDVWVKTVSGITNGNEVDFIVQGVLKKDGVSYAAAVVQEVTGLQNKHDSPAFVFNPLADDGFVPTT